LSHPLTVWSIREQRRDELRDPTMPPLFSDCCPSRRLPPRRQRCKKAVSVRTGTISPVARALLTAVLTEQAGRKRFWHTSGLTAAMKGRPARLLARWQRMCSDEARKAASSTETVSAHDEACSPLEAALEQQPALNRGLLDMTPASLHGDSPLAIADRHHLALRLGVQELSLCRSRASM